MFLFWAVLAFVSVMSIQDMCMHGVDDLSQIYWTVPVVVLVLVLIPIQIRHYIAIVRKRK
ncbi:MAG: hypothetical protein ACTHKU_03895 [Verrucomicrobiota bacterium]